MLIRFFRTGGFAGLRKSGSVDTETLPRDVRKNVEGLVDSAGFFSLPAQFPRPSKGADFFTYSVTIEDTGKTHTVEVSDPVMPASLRPLIRYLQETALNPH
jgi:hypothetical protein